VLCSCASSIPTGTGGRTPDRSLRPPPPRRGAPGRRDDRRLVVSFRRPAETTAAAGPGSRAIDRRVDRIDGSPEHHRYHPRAPHRFQGGGPLREVTTHRLRRPDHWHLVTYGLSELDGKESDDPLLSGWGFELTFRLAAGPDGVTASGGAAPDPPDRDRSGRTRRRVRPTRPTPPTPSRCGPSTCSPTWPPTCGPPGILSLPVTTSTSADRSASGVGAS
jgi:hypothetical protein